MDNIREKISQLRGWNAYISHCAENDLEMTGSDYDKTADYLNNAADTMERLLAAVTEIAEQPIGSEIKLPELADFEDAYLICVQTARAALVQTRQPTP